MYRAATAAPAAPRATAWPSSGTVQNNAFGGYVDSGSGEASDNSVTFNGGSVTNNIYGGMSAAGLAQNSVTMTNGSAKWLLGGYSANGNVIGNSINVSGGMLTGVSGGESNSGSATGNIVSISGGTVQSNVNGGFVASGSGKATGNIVKHFRQCRPEHCNRSGRNLKQRRLHRQYVEQKQRRRGTYRTKLCISKFWLQRKRQHWGAG